MSWVEGEKLIGDTIEDSSVSYGTPSEQKLFDLGLVKQGIQATLSQLIDKGRPYLCFYFFRFLICYYDSIYIPKRLHYIYIIIIIIIILKGVLHADPHLGNILKVKMPPGFGAEKKKFRLAYIDFGLVAKVPLGGYCFYVFFSFSLSLSLSLSLSRSKCIDVYFIIYRG